MGTAKLIKVKRDWYLCIPMSVDLKICETNKISKIVGIDRGLNFVVTTVDNENHSFFYRGKAIQRKREKYVVTRQKLQSKNTRNSRKRLLSIGKRENRWISDINHCISKTLVNKYGGGALFVIEDLTEITFDEKILAGSKKQKRTKRSWSFYQLEQYLKYKAEIAGSTVVNVSAKYTSQRCPICGKIDKTQRHHDKHEYICQCGYRGNDDRVGALNLLELGKRYLAGEKRPELRKENIAIRAYPVSCGRNQPSETKNLRCGDLKGDVNRYNLAGKCETFGNNCKPLVFAMG